MGALSQFPITGAHRPQSSLELNSTLSLPGFLGVAESKEPRRGRMYARRGFCSSIHEMTGFASGGSRSLYLAGPADNVRSVASCRLSSILQSLRVNGANIARPAMGAARSTVNDRLLANGLCVCGSRIEI